MMETFLMLLMGCSILTSLTTEAVKKLMDEGGKKYSANLIATVVSIMLAVGVSAAYLVVSHTALSTEIIVYIVALILLSFLCATLGYDKVMQTINQLKRV